MLYCSWIRKTEAVEMNSIFTEEQLNNMSREKLVELIKIMKNESLKKKYTKKKLKELHCLKRSQVGLNRNLATISHASDKYYNRQKSKLEVKKYNELE